MGSSVSLAALLLAVVSAVVGNPPLVHFDASDIAFVPPMVRYTQPADPTMYIGSDPYNCSVKDPEGHGADMPDPIGYMQVQFSLAETMLVALRLRVHTPDSMSDSFWGTLDLRTKQRWMVPRMATWGTVPYAPESAVNRRRQQFCHSLGAGNHTLRLLIREPGAAVASVTVLAAPALSSPPQQDGCSGKCMREGGSSARFTLDNLCGPDTLGQTSVTIGGRACEQLAVVGDSALSCVAPPYDGDADEVEVEVRQARDAVRFTIPYQGKPVDNSGIIIGVSVASGTIGAFVCVFASVVLWNRHKQKRQMEKLYGASTLAAEMAEAIAVLDFDVLEKLDNLEHPDRVQSAMKNILCNMKEFVKYIPHNVMQTVRGTHDDYGDDDESSPYVSSASGDEHRVGALGSDVSTSASGAGSLRSSSGRRSPQGHPSPRGRLSPRSQPSPRAQGQRLRTKSGAHAQPLKNAMARAKESDSWRNVAAMVVRPRQVRDAHGDVDVDAESHNSLLNHLYTVMEVTKGCIHRVCEDCVVAMWGATGAAPSKSRLLRAMMNVSDKAERAYHSGVYNQNSRCVYVGNSSMQSFCVLGGAVEEADSLSRLAVACGAPSLAKASLVSGSAFTGFQISPFFAVASATAGRGGRAVETAVFIGAVKESNKEWMYELEDREAQCGVDAVLDGLFAKRDRRLAIACMEKFKTGLGDGPMCPFAQWLCRFLDGTAADAAPGKTDDTEAAFTPPVLEVTTAGRLLSSDSKTLPFVEPVQLGRRKAGSEARDNPCPVPVI